VEVGMAGGKHWRQIGVVVYFTVKFVCHKCFYE
jgi:hypothetical protein